MYIPYRLRKRLYLLGGLLLVVLFLGSISLWIHSNYVTVEPEDEEGTLVFAEDPLSVDEYLKVKVGVAPGKIYLVDGCEGLVMSTSLSKTHSIQRALEHTLEARPDVYDVMYDLLMHYEVTPVLVKVYQLEEGSYYAQLVVEQEGKYLGLDAKPSDALALSSRFSVPLYVRKDLMDAQGQQVC
jgi:bifunctional DNase/RNase